MTKTTPRPATTTPTAAVSARKYFGTDGVRGRVGEAPITPELVLKLGWAAGLVLARGDATSRRERPGVLIGKDTRISGYLLEAALEAGFAAAGVDVYLCGPLPTPGIAHLTRALRLAAGVVVSASHNPFDDNGIKFFGPTGAKLPDAAELAIEQAMDEPLLCVASAELGKARRVDDASGRYIEFCKSTFPNNRALKGLKLVVDCAHGAAYHVAPAVFRELGADVVAVGVEPDGLNINAGVGATAPAYLAREVVAHHADMGIALDGDGDRLIMVDAHGRIFDGDELLYIVARDYQHRDVLGGGVVGTQMSNLGFEQALARAGIELVRAQVGDRYVLERMVDKNWRLGGENSGHLICLDKHTTGDAIVAALAVLRALGERNMTLAQGTHGMTLFPQRLINVPVRRGFDWRNDATVVQAETAAAKALGTAGRILLRPSGTEPVLRVMVEARDAALADTHAQAVAQVIAHAAGLRL